MKTQLLIAQATDIVNITGIQNGWQALTVCVGAICIAWVMTTLFKAMS